MYAITSLRFAWAIVAISTVSTANLVAEEPGTNSKRHEFTTMIAHLSGYTSPGYIEFVRDARPDVAQFGFYGAHFWGLVLICS